MDMMEGRERDYAIYVRDFVMDPEYVKYLYENGLKKEAKRVEKIALREKMKLKEKGEEKLECVIEKKEEKYLRKNEKEIESIPVTFQKSIIPTIISSSTTTALQVTHVSLSPREVGGEKINSTFERNREEFILKGKKQEDAKNDISQFEEENKNKRSKENVKIKIESFLVNEHVGKEELLSWDLTNIFLHNGVCSPTNAISVCSNAYSILEEGERTIPRDEPSEFNITVFEPGG